MADEVRRCRSCGHPCESYECKNCGAMNPTGEYWIAFLIVLAVIIGLVVWVIKAMSSPV